MLHLERPLVFFDLEATGTDPQAARIIQIGMQRFVPSEDGAALDETIDVLVDPEEEIPAAVTDLTGLSPDAVRQAPPLGAHLDRIAPLLADADLAGYNALAYDIPLLQAEFERHGRVLQRQLADHDIDGTPADLAQQIRGDYLDDQRRLKQDGDAVVVCFGKHDGKTLRDIQRDHPGYFDWMYETIDDLRPHIDEALE